MTKQRRSFFVDDILHMVMPIEKNTHCSNENGDLKRKRSISPKDGNQNEEDQILNKKFRSQNHGRNVHNNDDESNYSHVVDIIGDEESCTSDNSNNIDNNSGKLKQHI
jgi:hypothetical protein